MRTIPFEVPAGTHIKGACRDATNLARKERSLVRFEFNGTQLTAAPKKSHFTILWEWEVAQSREAISYRNSPEFKAAENDRLRASEKRQDRVAVALMLLPSVLQPMNLDGVIRWLDDFTKDADYTGVSFDHGSLADLFESHGFKENDLVGEAPESFNTRNRVGRYIVGQAVNCLRNGMPPHPILHKFAQMYFSLAS